MKSLKDLSMNLPEQEYHDYPAWSYSTIAKYAKDGFSAIATLHDKVVSTPSMEFGSLFDSILTRGKETLNEYVVDDTTAPPKETEVFDRLIASGHKEPFMEIPRNTVDLAMDGCSFYNNLKPDTRYDKLVKSCAYYDVRRSGKKIVSKADWEDAVEMARAFRNDSYLNKLFGTKNTEDIEYIYQAQFKLNWEIGDRIVEVKIMPDLIVVNHKEKTIQPVDLKTSAMPAYDFAENFLKYKYYIQAELYTDVVTRITNHLEEYKDYTVLPYIFSDISRSDKVPVSYEYDPRNGFSFTKNDKTYTYKGWKELLEEILDYEESEAKVPNYIKTDGPNDLIEILSR